MSKKNIDTTIDADPGQEDGKAGSGVGSTGHWRVTEGHYIRYTVSPLTRLVRGFHDKNN